MHALFAWSHSPFARKASPTGLPLFTPSLARLASLALHPQNLDTECPVLRIGDQLIFHGRHATYVGTAAIVDCTNGSSMDVVGMTRRRVVFKLVAGDISKATGEAGGK